MPDLASSDVTYTINNREQADGGLIRNQVTIAFGDGALTYPSGGVPLDANKMGLPVGEIRSLKIVERNLAADGFDIDYDKSANKLLMYKYDYDAVADGGAITLVATTDTPAATSLEVEVIGY